MLHPSVLLLSYLGVALAVLAMNKGRSRLNRLLDRYLEGVLRPVKRVDYLKTVSAAAPIVSLLIIMDQAAQTTATILTNRDIRRTTTIPCQRDGTMMKTRQQQLITCMRVDRRALLRL